jgi:hypothetical protein
MRACNLLVVFHIFVFYIFFKCLSHLLFTFSFTSFVISFTYLSHIFSHIFFTSLVHISFHICFHICFTSLFSNRHVGVVGCVLNLEGVCDVFVGRSLNEKIRFEVSSEKRCYVVVIEGRGKICNQNVIEGDGGTAVGPITLEIDAENLHILFITVAQPKK